MDEAADLDSFFSEINEIYPVVNQDVTEKNEELVISAPKVISKPAVKAITNHAVYTYNVDNYNLNLDGNDEAFLSGDKTAKSSNSQEFSNQTKPINIQIAPSLPSTFATNTNGLGGNKTIAAKMPAQDKKFVRKAADDVWIDETLKDWPENDFRIFVGDIAKEVSTDMLIKLFQHYPSFARAKVLRTKHENKARGFGFVSFLDPMDCAKAIREMNGKYLGSRPMKITKSRWKERDIKEVAKKEKKKRKLDESLGLT
eukprot:gene12206-16351_t